MSNQWSRVASLDTPSANTEQGLLARSGRGARRVKGVLERISFFQQFALFSLVILIVGAVVIGRWVSGEIEHGVINRSAAVTALYVDSFASPNLQELEAANQVSPAYLARLDALLGTTSLGHEIVSFKVWALDGTIVYARDHAIIGRVYPLGDDLHKAQAGQVVSNMSSLEDEENAAERVLADRLVETYAPIRSQETNDVIGVMEFYLSPDAIEEEITDSQRTGWLIVGASTLAMYVLLVGMVNRASSTITSQNRDLRKLLTKNAELSERLRFAAASKAETDEQVMVRLGHDLHDGPAQDLGFAMLRLDDLRDVCAAGAVKPPEDFDTIREALDRALREIRDIAAGLRLPELEAMSVRQVVDRALDEHRRKTGMTVRFETAKAVSDVDAATAIKIALYRVAKESLHNAWKHSGASEAFIALGIEHDAILLQVGDRGAGFDMGRVNTRTSLGLRGMRERIELLGGEFTVRSEPEMGTTIVARVPYGGAAR